MGFYDLGSDGAFVNGASQLSLEFTFIMVLKFSIFQTLCVQAKFRPNIVREVKTSRRHKETNLLLGLKSVSCEGLIKEHRTMVCVFNHLNACLARYLQM